MQRNHRKSSLIVHLQRRCENSRRHKVQNQISKFGHFVSAGLFASHHITYVTNCGWSKVSDMHIIWSLLIWRMMYTTCHFLSVQHMYVPRVLLLLSLSHNLICIQPCKTIPEFWIYAYTYINIQVAYPCAHNIGPANKVNLAGWWVPSLQNMILYSICLNLRAHLPYIQK